MTTQEKTLFMKKPVFQCRICISCGTVVFKNIDKGRCPEHNLTLHHQGTLRDVYNRY